VQDFARLKSQVCNNLSLCYCQLNDLEQADIWNNQALLEDPDYPKAIFRKCAILEMQGRFANAVEMVGWGLSLLGNEFVDQPEEEAKLKIPFEDLKERCLKLVDQESALNTQKLKRDVEEELLECLGKNRDACLEDLFENIDKTQEEAENDQVFITTK